MGDIHPPPVPLIRGMYGPYPDEGNFKIFNHTAHSPGEIYFYHHPMRHPDMDQGNNQPQNQNGVSQVNCTEDSFSVTQDLTFFNPDDISVQMVGGWLVVSGEHSKKRMDDVEDITRSFTRRYFLPERCILDEVVCEMGADGVLKITVPRTQVTEEHVAKVIPVRHSGKKEFPREKPRTPDFPAWE